ncbi:MAG: hypothetical protein ACYTGN_07815 [Planctomycetota bacterium]|jgi:hypothetical protein
MRLMGVATISVLAVFAAAQGGPELTKEPPQLLVLSVDGKDVPVQIGKPFELEIGGRKVACALKARDYRVFESGGVRFRYPERLAYTCDKDDGTCWFEGGATVVMFQTQDRGVKPADALAELADALNEQYGAKNVKASKTTIQLGGRAIEGRRVNAKVFGEHIRQDFYVFPTAKATCILMLQTEPLKDSIPEESKRVFELLRRSFEFTEPKTED